MFILYNDDCINVMNSIDPKSVDAIITDLPYGTTACKWDTIIPFDKMWNGIKRVLKPGGVFITTSSQPFTSALVMSNPSWFKYEWIYEKNYATGHLDAKRKPMKAHENILVFCEKGFPKYRPIKTTGHIRKISTAVHKQNSSNNQSEIYHKSDKFVDYDSTERYPRSVITFKSDKQKKRLHPTQKPVALYEYIIKTYTDAEDTILDICMGSGTTIEAAESTNRNSIGIEKDRSIFQIAMGRLHITAENDPHLKAVDINSR